MAKKVKEVKPVEVKKAVPPTVQPPPR